MGKIFQILMVVMLLFPVCARAQSSSLAQKARSRNEAIKNSHNDRAKKLKAEHEAFKREIMQRWGEREMVESTKKVWVE